MKTRPQSVFQWLCVRNNLQASNKNITLELHFGNSIGNTSLNIKGDKHKLGQVMRNLVINALKFTPTGRLVRMDVSLNNNNDLWIDVTDEGVGISKVVESESPNKP